jgi:type IV pilus assembly protein PilA
LNQPSQVVVAGLLAFVGLGAAVCLFVPSSDGSRHETAAINSLRTINTVQQRFAGRHPGHGFACSLRTLRDAETTGSQGALLKSDLAEGRADGYFFYISECVRQNEHVTAYKAIAVPVTVKEGSKRGYCTDQGAHIYYDPRGGSQCTELMQ